MKHFYSLLLAMVLPLFSAYAYDFTVGECSFNILSEEEATVVLAKGTGPTNTNEWILPSTVTNDGKTYTVTEIGERAITNISIRDLSIEIPATIKTIGDYGISTCWYMYWITIKSSEEPLNVGKGFLNSCSNLETAEIFRQIIYPDANTSTGFSGKSKMTSVVIGGGYHNINPREFQSCTVLEHVGIGSPIYSIGEYAFCNTPKLTLITSYDWDKNVDNFDSVTEMGASAFSRSGIRYAIVPAALKNIPDYAYSECPNLTSFTVDFERSVETIGRGVCSKCTALNTVEIDKSVKSIGASAFDGCTALTKFVLLPGEADLNFEARSGDLTTFENCPLETLNIYRNITNNTDDRYYNQLFQGITTLKSVTLGDDVKVIPGNIFNGCTGLESVSLSNNITEINWSAFSGCTALKGIKLPKNLMRMGSNTFYNCTSLSKIVFNPNLKEIGNASFRNTAISELSIPASVTMIWEHCFADCGKLVKVTFEDGDSELQCNHDTFLNTPATDVNIGRSFKNASYTQGGRTFKELPFKGHPGIQNVTFTSGAKVVTDQSFYECPNLSRVIFQNGVETIGSWAFENCPKISSLSFPYTLKEIESFAFNGCTSLSFVGFNYPENGEAVEPVKLSYANTNKGLFSDCPLTEVYLGRDLEYDSSYRCGYSPFANIATIQRVGIVEPHVSTIGNYLFYNCTGLTEVYMPNSMKTIGNQSFAGCTSLKNIGWGNGLTSLGNRAFSNCKSIENINSPVEIAPTTGTEVFPVELYESATLNITESSISSYLNEETWKHFFNIKSGEKLFAHSISLNLSDLTLKPGESAKIEYTILPTNATSKAAKWTTSDEAVATISDDGQITAVKSGNTIITATCTDGTQLSASCNVKVELLVSGLTLNETTLTLSEGESYQLTASITPETADNPTIQWISSDPNIAGVDENGKVSAVSQGNATITAKTSDSSNLSATCSITVIKRVSEIQLNLSNVDLYEGQTDQLSAEVLPTSANNKVLEWSSSNENVVTVDNQGLITAVSQGSAKIIAKSTDGSDIVAECNVNVLKRATSISLNETDATLVENQSLQLTASVLPENADNRAVEWSSSNDNVATVDNNGLVTAIAQGEAFITAITADGSLLTASCHIKVVKLVSSITLNETDLTLTEGSTTKLSATISPELADNQYLKWETSNEAIAVVNMNGEVTAKSQGNAVITVTSTDGSNISAYCNVTVIKLVSSIELSSHNVELKAGEYERLIATVNPTDATDTSIVWSSSDNSIAQVENGIIIAISDGECDVTATANDGSNVSATCHVVVRTLVSQIILDKTELNLQVGKFDNITATVLPTNATNKDVSWSSSDESIVTVQDGLVLAHAKGEALITVTAADGSGIYATCAVKVEEEAGIDDISYDSISLEVINHDIVVKNVQNGITVSVFQLDGTEIFREVSNGNTVRFTNVSNGFLIVTIGNHSYKIIVK